MNMIYTYILVAIFIFVVIPALFITKSSKYDKYFYVFLSIILFIYVAFRPIGIDRDSKSYVALFYSNIDIEVTFKSIKFIINRFLRGEVQYIFVIYALIGVSLKLKILRALSPLFILSILVYLSNFILQQDLTAIRAGAASTFILLSLIPLKNRNFFVFTLFIFSATLFHYSAFVALLLWFLSYKSMHKIYYLIVPIGFLLYIFTSHYTISNQIPILYFQNKLEAYLQSQEQGNQEINVLNAFLFIKCLIYYFLLYNSKKLIAYNLYFPILIKMYGWSIFIFLSFSFIPVLSFRISDFFGISEILLIPLITSLFKDKLIGNGVVVGYCSLIFIYNIFIGKMLLI